MMKPVSWMICPSYVTFIIHDVCISLWVSDAFTGPWMHLAFTILSFSIWKAGMFVHKLMLSSLWHQKKTTCEKKSLHQQPARLWFLLCTELVMKKLYWKIWCLNKPLYAWLSIRTITQLNCSVTLWDQSAFLAMKEWLSLEQAFCMGLLPTLGLETLRALTQWCSLLQQHPRKQWKVISILLQRNKFHQFTKITQVWSLKLLKKDSRRVDRSDWCLVHTQQILC